jgi:quercetin dioxygenase-like cupin family protein
MIHKYKSALISQPFAGVTRRVLAHSQQIMLTEHRLEKGAVLPEHHHPQQQLVYFLEGKIEMEMNGSKFEASPGDSFVVLPNVPHKVIALEKSVALDIFTPAREDYLPQL